MHNALGRQVGQINSMAKGATTVYELVIETDFAAAHKLRDYSGDCENLHGHNWRLEVVLCAEKLDEMGMVCDFRLVKRHLKTVTDMLDHKYLNELDAFSEANPTTENVARFVCEELDNLLPEDLHVSRVTAWESDHCGATYFNSKV